MTFTGDNFTYGSQYFGGDGKYDKDKDKEEDQPVVETPIVKEEPQVQGQTHDPYGPNYIGPSNLGNAPISAIGDTALLGVAYYTIKNPLHVLELIGAASTDAKNFTDIQSELISQQRTFNPIQKTKNIVKGGSVVFDTVNQIINPRKVQVATAGGTPLPGSIFSQGVDDVALHKNFFEARTSSGIGFGSTKNIPFKGTTRGAIDLSKMSTSARKTAKQNFFTNIYTADKSEQGLKAVKWARRYLFGGKANITGTHRDIFQMAPHHFTIDDDLAFLAANTADAPEFVKELHKFDIYPGNHPRNFIAAYHDNTKKGWNETIAQIKKLWGNNTNRPTDNAIIKFLKNPTQGIEFGRDTKLEDIGKQLVTIQQKGLQGKDWSRILPEGKTIKDVKISPVVLGIDHQQLIHGVVDNLPSRQKLIKLIESDQWLKLSPRQRAIEVARVSRESQNVALRINQIRLNLIKNRMNELGKSTEHWTDIQAWMAANPSEAASLSWHKLTQGTGLTVNDLIQDLPKDEVKEIATIFNLEAIPNTGELLDKLDKTPPKTFQQL